MAREDAVRVEGRIVQALQSVLFRVVLSNDHSLLGYVGSGGRQNRLDYGVGDRVLIEVSPFDLSKGTILEKLSK